MTVLPNGLQQVLTPFTGTVSLAVTEHPFQTIAEVIGKVRASDQSVDQPDSFVRFGGCGKRASLSQSRNSSGKVKRRSAEQRSIITLRRGMNTPARQMLLNVMIDRLLNRYLFRNQICRDQYRRDQNHQQAMEMTQHKRLFGMNGFGGRKGRKPQFLIECVSNNRLARFDA